MDAPRLLHVVISVFLILAICAASQAGELKPKPWKESPAPEAGQGSIVCRFAEIPVGGLPAGWRADVLNGKGYMPRWEVVADPDEPARGRVLAMTGQAHASKKTANLFWNESIRFMDGTLEVDFKVVSGEKSEGGGLMWRIQDEDNYYLAAYNPKKGEFSICRIADGKSKKLRSEKMRLPEGEWGKIGVIAEGPHFQGYLNGNKAIDLMDNAFTSAGGVGFCTQADTRMCFDNFIITPGARLPGR